MSNADPNGTIGETPPLLRAARNAQDARIARVTAEARERDQRVIDELRDRAVSLTAEILGVETAPEEWHPHRDPISSSGGIVPKLRGVLADVGGVTILADRDDRFQTALRPAMVDPDGVLIASRFPVTNLADLPERLEEVETTLAEVEAIIGQGFDLDGPEADPAPTPDQTADRLFGLDAARRAADRGDVAAAVLYLAGRVDLLASALLGIPDDAEPDPADVLDE